MRVAVTTRRNGEHAALSRALCPGVRLSPFDTPNAGCTRTCARDICSREIESCLARNLRASMSPEIYREEIWRKYRAIAADEPGEKARVRTKLMTAAVTIMEIIPIVNANFIRGSVYTICVARARRWTTYFASLDVENSLCKFRNARRMRKNAVTVTAIIMEINTTAFNVFRNRAHRWPWPVPRATRREFF